MFSITRVLLICFLLFTFFIHAETAKDWYEKGNDTILASKKIEYFSKAIQLDPKDAGSYCYRGYAKASIGQTDKAIEDFKSAIKVDPNSYCSYMGLGEVYFELERYQDAIKEFSKAHEILPNSKGALRRRAAAKRAIGDNSGADDDFKAPDQNTASPFPSNNSFRMYYLIFILIAGFHFFVGLRGVIKKKPFVFSARWMFLMIVLTFTPQIFDSLRMYRTGWAMDLSLMLIASPLMFLFLIILFWFQMRGYYVYGVTDKSFRAGLHAALAKLGLNYEEQLSSIYLPSEDASLQVSVHSWMGTAQLKAKDKKLERRLKQIASEMTGYYSTNTVETNKKSFYVYIVLGIFLLIMTGSLWTMV